MSDSASSLGASDSDEGFTILSKGQVSSPREDPSAGGSPPEMIYPTLPTESSTDDEATITPPSPLESIPLSKPKAKQAPLWVLASSFFLLLALTAFQVWRLRTICEACHNRLKVMQTGGPDFSGYAVEVTIRRVGSQENLHAAKVPVVLITPPECRNQMPRPIHPVPHDCRLMVVVVADHQEHQLFHDDPRPMARESRKNLLMLYDWSRLPEMRSRLSLVGDRFQRRMTSLGSRLAGILADVRSRIRVALQDERIGEFRRNAREKIVSLSSILKGPLGSWQR